MFNLVSLSIKKCSVYQSLGFAFLCDLLCSNLIRWVAVVISSKLKYVTTLQQDRCARYHLIFDGQPLLHFFVFFCFVFTLSGAFPGGFVTLELPFIVQFLFVQKNLIRKVKAIFTFYNYAGDFFTYNSYIHPTSMFDYYEDEIPTKCLRQFALKFL